MPDINLEKVLDVITDETKVTTIEEYRTELIMKLHSLMEKEINKFFDAVADDELAGTYKTPLKTVVPVEGEEIVLEPIDPKQATIPFPEQPQAAPVRQIRQDRKGSNKVWNK